MAKRSLWSSIQLFETTLSAAEWAWRIVALVAIGGTSTWAGLLAKADPILGRLGPIYWVAIGLAVALIAAVILYLIKAANAQQSLATLNQTLSSKPTSVNPLATSFRDAIIAIEDLRLPSAQLHENKQFINCKFVGPAALAINGGTYTNNNFLEGGDIVALPPDTALVGLVVLRNCTVQHCDFIRVSIFVDHGTGHHMRAAGASVKGLAPSR